MGEGGGTLARGLTAPHLRRATRGWDAAPIVLEIGLERLKDEETRAPRRRHHRREPGRFLITGGAGFVGSHLTDALLARGDAVTVLDDLSTGRRQNLRGAEGQESFTFVEGTTSDADLVDALMREADVCLHLASAVGVQLVVENALPSLLGNVRGSDNVLMAAARHGRRVLFASTSEVYGKNSDSNLGEHDDRILGSSAKSRWGYALAKGFGEALAQYLHHEYDADTVVVRLFNTVGARQRGAYGMVLPRFVERALRDDPLTVYGGGEQTRCFTHVTDTMNAVIALADAEPASGRIFNVGTTQEVSIRDLAERVIDRVGSSSTIELVPYEAAFGTGFEELGRRVPDNTALRELTGWAPERTIDDAIDDVIAFQRAALETAGPA